MTAYDREDERAIRVGRLVEEWTRSGLLTPDQRSVLLPQLRVDLRRTNVYLRTTLFIFNVMIIQSTLGLGVIALGLASAASGAVLCIVGAAVSYWLAGVLVDKYRLYHFGVEEAAALGAVAFVAAAAALLVSTAWSTPGDWPVVVGLAAAAAAALQVFRRFGYVYAAVIASACASALPFGFGVDETIQRTGAISILAAIAAVARMRHTEFGDDHPGDSFAMIEAVAWLGIYLAVNLQLTAGATLAATRAWFYWLTYAGIWAVPIAGLWLAVRRRDRWLLRANLLMALATVMSNKPYLGATRYAWDPIVFGLVLMGIAIGIRRWLAAGLGETRHGYTASRVLASDASSLAGIAIASAAFPGAPGADTPKTPDAPIGGGGASGGAGATGRF